MLHCIPISSPRRRRCQKNRFQVAHTLINRFAVIIWTLSLLTPIHSPSLRSARGVSRVILTPVLIYCPNSCKSSSSTTPKLRVDEGFSGSCRSRCGFGTRYAECYCVASFLFPCAFLLASRRFSYDSTKATNQLSLQVLYGT